MLQSIRDRLQGWIAGAIIVILCAVFALWGIRNYLGTNAQSDVAATVNGFSIHLNDLNSEYQQIQQQQAQMGANYVVDSATELKLKEYALNDLILRHILAEAATKAGYRIIPGEVAEAILSIPRFLVNGMFSREQFDQYLAENNITEQQFLTKLQARMLISQVTSGYVDSAFSLPSDIDTAIKLVNQKRDFGYIIVPASQFTKSVMITPAQAQDYYNSHTANFISPEQVSIQYVELSASQMADKLRFTDSQLNQYYQDNLANFTKPQRWHIAVILAQVPNGATPDVVANVKTKIDNIYQQVVSGGNFAQLAKQDSDDASSADNGGVLDWFSAGSLDPALETATAGLKQVGDVSQPVQVKNGFVIIKLIGVQPAQVQSFVDVKAQVQKALAQQQAAQAFSDATDKLSNITYSNPTSLEEAAKDLGLTINSTGLFSRQGGKDSITANPKVIDAAFSSDVLQGNNSDVISLDPNTAIVLRVTQHVSAATQPFSAVSAQVNQQLTLQLASQKAQAYGQGLVQAIQQGKKPDEVAKQANLKWTQMSNVGRFDMKAPPALLFELFRMPRPTSKNPLSVDGMAMPNGDYAVLALSAVTDGSFSPNQQAVQERIYREELENSYGQLDYSLYMKGLVNKSKININKSVITGTTDQTSS